MLLGTGGKSSHAGFEPGELRGDDIMAGGDRSEGIKGPSGLTPSAPQGQGLSLEGKGIEPPPQGGGVRFRLSVMMFLNIFVWGAWLPLLQPYIEKLGFNATWQQPLIFGAFNIAALTAMFFGTQFVDRYFAAERFLAFSMLVAGVSILALKWTTEFWPFFALMLLYSLFYVPTISITNSIAFANLRDPQREFGPVRLWGTIGWIAVAWPFVFVLADWARIPALGSVPFRDWLGAVLNTSKEGDAAQEARSYIFVAAGGASLLLAVFSLFLPHTPPRPPSQASERLAWLEALKLLAVPFVFVLFLVTFLDAAVHASYFFLTAKYLQEAVHIPGHWIMPVMTIGQLAEIITMAFLGVVLKGLGWRWTMFLGILGHVARFTVFALYPEPWAAIAVNVLHGICYAFFFATVYIFVDEFFPKDARSSAQGLFNFLILGLGPFVGNFAAGQLLAMFTQDVALLGMGEKMVFTTMTDFRTVFLIPAAVGLGAALLLLLFFHPPAKADRGEEKKPPEFA
jgi:nucleoside transporter